MNEPTFVLIQTEGWNPETQQDETLDTIAVSIMVPVSGQEGKWLTKECKTSDELWNYLQYLDMDKVAALAREFDYHGPVAIAHKRVISADELLNELSSI